MDRKLDLDNAFSDLFTRRKLTVLLLSWLIGIVALLSYRTISARDMGVLCPKPVDLSVLDRNETGPFVSWRPGALVEARPQYHVRFDNLRAENGRLGFFRTATNKTAWIDNLHATLSLPDASACGHGIRLETFSDLFAPRRQEPFHHGQIGVLNDLQNSASDGSVGIDMTNTTLVQIRNMVWEIRRADQTILTVQCRRACLRPDTSYVLLQGHATVTTPGATLEGNCIKMNVRDNCFVVDGRYLLTRSGHRQNGIGGCFDTTLNPCQFASSDGKERNEWMHGYPLAVF